MKCYLDFDNNKDYSYEDYFENFKHELDRDIELPNEKFNDILVLGIGGSSLGTQAIYEFLKYSKHLSNMWFLESFDPIILNDTIKKIDLKNCIVNVVSKSGNTLEVIGILRYLLSINKDLNFVVITDKGSKLDLFAKDHSAKVYYIAENIGGRFSFFTSSTLVPLSYAGVDVLSIKNGVKEFFNEYSSGKELFNSLNYKAEVYSKNMFKLVLFSYSNLFTKFNQWYIQLIAESLSKFDDKGNRISLLPISLIGSQDQHSYLQLLVEGTLDKNVTFITIEDFGVKIKVPNDKIDIAGGEIFDGREYGELLQKQAYSTKDSLNGLNIFTDMITLEKIDEKEITKLMSYYIILTMILSKRLDINPFGQNGVEISKTIFKRILKDGK